MGWAPHETFDIIVMSSIVLSIFLLSIGASFIQRTTGFGFGIFIMTMLPFLMPTYGEATTLSHSAHHGFRLWHLHHDDASIPHAKLWRSYDTLRTPGYHDFCSYRMAIAKLRHLAAALADSADVYHCLDYCHFRPDTYRRPHLTTYSWCSTHSDQHLLYAV